MRPLLVLLVLVRVAYAHQTSVKYVDVTLAGARAELAVQVAPGDVTEPLGLPADATPTAATAAASAAVPPYVAAWITTRAHDAACSASAPAATSDGKFVTVRWTATCASPPDTLDFAKFFAVDRRHVAIVRVDGGDGQIVRADQPTFAIRGTRSLLAWIRTGMDHIYTGFDHICFVLSLLLVVMLYRGIGREWHTRAPLLTLRSTAAVITAFTIAHSISLIAAALGYVTLPSRFVETMIAASIAYTAVEDIVKPDVTWRFFLTFAFGLVHGLGFASTLAELLPPRDVVVPLLCFNIGVEIGQLTIVALALPLFYMCARALGAARYRRVALPILAGTIAVLGTLMMIERIAKVTILGM